MLNEIIELVQFLDSVSGTRQVFNGLPFPSPMHESEK